MGLAAPSLHYITAEKHSSLLECHYHKLHYIYNITLLGKIGDWKNHFTVADNELFDSVLEKWTAGKEIPFIYKPSSATSK